MYISPRTGIPTITPKVNGHKTAILVLPKPSPSIDKNLERFVEIIESLFKKINNSNSPDVWELIKIYPSCAEMDYAQKYSAIYNSDIVITECSNKDPDVFYVLGLAHSCGLPVCSCYNNSESDNIPFNLYGRQSLTYSNNSLVDQRNWEARLREWITRFGE